MSAKHVYWKSIGYPMESHPPNGLRAGARHDRRLLNIRDVSLLKVTERAAADMITCSQIQS